MAQISKLVWRTADVPEELHELLATLEEEYPVSGYGRGLKLKAKRVKGEGTISRVKRSPGTVLVEYNSIAAAARGIGSALGKSSVMKKLRSKRSESCSMFPATWSCGSIT